MAFDALLVVKVGLVAPLRSKCLLSAERDKVIISLVADLALAIKR